MNQIDPHFIPKCANPEFSNGGNSGLSCLQHALNPAHVRDTSFRGRTVLELKMSHSIDHFNIRKALASLLSHYSWPILAQLLGALIGDEPHFSIAKRLGAIANPKYLADPDKHFSYTNEHCTRGSRHHRRGGVRSALTVAIARIAKSAHNSIETKSALYALTQLTSKNSYMPCKDT
jgi:hypothetical protein